MRIKSGKKNKPIEDIGMEVVNERNFLNNQDKGCVKCGKNHNGECRVGTGVCFKCGKKGHFAKECHADQ